MCFINRDGELEGFRVNRAEGNRLFPQQMPKNLRPGLALYRNNDMEFERQLARQSSVRKIPMTFSLKETEDGFSLSALDVTVDVACEHQMAEKSPRENKLGGTPYECSRVELADDFNWFIPSSLLADMRRQWVEKINSIKSNPSIIRVNANIDSHAVAPLYDYPYLYNISNQQAQQFYGVKSLTAYELKPANGPLMQCRHCLRYALGYCVKNGGRKPQWKEPLSLRLGDGRTFRLEFDCKHCQMNVWER